MNSEIEILDKRRMRLLQWYLVGCGFFIILSLTRFFFRRAGLNSQPIGVAVLVGLLLCLAVLILSTIGSVRLAQKIKNDPSLQEALYNELVRSLEVQSWRSAFFGAIATNVFFALAWFFYPVCDPVMVSLTSLIVGLGAYQATFYLKYRSL